MKKKMSFSVHFNPNLLFLIDMWGIFLQASHDGHDVFFLLQVDGNYAYTKG